MTGQLRKLSLCGIGLTSTVKFASFRRTQKNNRASGVRLAGGSALYGRCGLSDVDNVESDRLSTFTKESDSMFNQLFFRSDALTRQLSAPLVDERRRYLAHSAAQGMSKCTLRMKARLLLSIAEYLRSAERPNDAISLVELAHARLPHFRSGTHGRQSDADGPRFAATKRRYLRASSAAA